MRREAEERAEQERALAYKSKSRDSIIALDEKPPDDEDVPKKDRTTSEEEEEFTGFDDKEPEEMDALTAAKRAFVAHLLLPSSPPPSRVTSSFPRHLLLPSCLRTVVGES